MNKSLLKSTTSISSITMLSRVFGFIRDVVTAGIFGATASFDAFSVAFRIPNFMRRLFAEGSFAQAFVPVLSERQKALPHDALQRFINAVFGSLGFILLIVTIIGVLCAPIIVRLFAPGFIKNGGRLDLAVTMLRITFPYLLFISLTAFLGAILNTYQRFWAAALTPIFLNICMIAAAIFVSPHFKTPIVALAWAVLIAGIIQLLFSWPFVKRLHFQLRPCINFNDPGVKRILQLMMPALFGVSVSQLNLLLDTLFASLLQVGSISWLYYSDRLMEFPLGVFGVAISTVILPHLSRHYVNQTVNDFSSTIDWALRLIFLVGFPAMLFLGIAGGPLLSTLFQHGPFTARAVLMSQKSLSMFALGIIPFMLVKIFASSFYAKQDLKTPVKIGIGAMVSNMILNVIFIWPLQHAGIALATSLSAVLNSGLLFYFLRKQKIYFSSIKWGKFFLRLAIVNIVLLIWLWWFAGNVQEWILASIKWRIEHLFVLCITAAFIYFLMLGIVGLRIKDFMYQSQSLS